jgi:fluoroacetyl-CoA thioesterase
MCDAGAEVAWQRLPMATHQRWRLSQKVAAWLGRCPSVPGHGYQSFGQKADGSMRKIPVGAKATFKMSVRPEHLANQFKDAMLPQVLATPVMIMMMENAALNAIRPYLDPGESAVGIAINVSHMAATPVGHEVVAEAEVTNVDRRRVEFKVSARDATDEIGNGTHERMIIDLGSFNERLAIKSKR